VLGQWLVADFPLQGTIAGNVVPGRSLFILISNIADLKRVYRSQLRGSNGFSPFSLLVMVRIHSNVILTEQTNFNCIIIGKFCATFGQFLTTAL
jgi:hypothetical protein